MRSDKPIRLRVQDEADYGDNPHFLNGLEARGERYVAAVRASFSVTLGRGQPARCSGPM